jgi:uncharacterized HAD superfamily protein/adenine/guanine phosphoribosyltransferase-like PRPP-binding protein
MNYKSFDELSADIKKNLPKIHDGEYDLVVGIPRSGMVPAYMISLYLNVSVTDFDGFLENRVLKNGDTRKSKSCSIYPHEANRVLLVDDSILSGKSLKKALNNVPEKMTGKVTTLAIYGNRAKRNDVDLILEVVRSPRIFEWNIFHRELLNKACVDIDGVLCIDPTDKENDDGDNYKAFLLNAKPYIIPTYRIHSLVTSRLEKYRKETEQWLKMHGILYDNLIMLDLPSKEERLKKRAHATHKASYFKSSNELEIFIESDFQQSLSINKISNKPVYCMDKNVMVRDSSLVGSIKNPSYFSKRLKLAISSRLPYSFKRILKRILQKV